MDPESMMLVMRTTQAMARTPTDLNLTLRPSSVGVVFADSTKLALPLSREETKFIQGGVDVIATAKWTKTGLEIERKVDGGGGVKDTFYVDEDGRLLLKREIEPLRGGKVEGILIYARKKG